MVLGFEGRYNWTLHWESNSDFLVWFYLSIKYNFVVKYSIGISVETSYGFKIGSIKVTDLGSLFTENDDEILV